MVSFALDPPASWSGLSGAASAELQRTSGEQSVDDQLRVAEDLVRQMGGRDLRATK